MTDALPDERWLCDGCDSVTGRCLSVPGCPRFAHDALPDDELRAMSERATPGPWAIGWGRPSLTIEAGEKGDDEVLDSAPVDCMSHCYGGSSRWELSDEDAALIAAMRNALPSLLDRLAHAEARTAEAVEALEDWDRWADWLGGMDEASNVFDVTDEATTVIGIDVEELARRIVAQVRAARGATEGRGGAGEES